jgi:ATP-binding cassette, subfamily G (WHITE), member 2, SNQ2
VTDPNGRILRSGFESRAPRNAIEFAEHFNRSMIAQENLEDINAYKKEFVGNSDRQLMYKDSVKADHATTARPRSPYIISIPMQARALMIRRAQILKGGITLQVVQVV